MTTAIQCDHKWEIVEQNDTANDTEIIYQCTKCKDIKTKVV